VFVDHTRGYCRWSRRKDCSRRIVTQEGPKTGIGEVRPKWKELAHQEAKAKRRSRKPRDKSDGVVRIDVPWPWKCGQGCLRPSPSDPRTRSSPSLKLEVNLPQGLLDEILSHLPSDGGRPLRACSLVTKSWACPAQRQLFSSVTNRPRRPLPVTEEVYVACKHPVASPRMFAPLLRMDPQTFA